MRDPRPDTGSNLNRPRETIMASHSISPPQGASIGLDLFAAAWVEHWTQKGGSIIFQSDGRANIGWPEYDFNPMRQTAPEGMSGAHKEEHESILAANYDGAMRSLFELMKAVPGGVEAVKAHVAAFPSFMTAEGCKGIWAG